MSFDIYGNNLRHGHCEVHPHVHEEYPCSVCIVEAAQREEQQRRPYCDGDQRFCESAHYLAQASEHIKDQERTIATQQSRLEALEKEQSAWRKFTDEANRTLEAADKKIATLQARIEALEAELAALREAAAKAKWLLDDATYHDGRYGQQSAPDWQKRACKVSDDLAALLQEGE